ncbi:DNA/RNA non-specific endonuclease [uncultured Intestinibacter sp.]|uniref:DNA/RNA non-specific endonuclease n=1 Tax=uncultured Intestinibacter sp. TaxID=1505659 RepID=UPI0027DC9EFF|nr:DNA/RNA non-specific endonuclease [uncultured Intestinibacter sp.]
MKLLRFLMVFLLSLMLVGCEADDTSLNNSLLGAVKGSTTTTDSSVNNIPEYSGEDFVALNNNVPNFDEKDKTTTSFETYSPLDSLGRCGEAYANIGRDLMPTQKRGDISSVKPSGWLNKKYDTSLVDGGYIYNRCHLIGHQLAGEDANERNLITGTRYFNVDGMLPFENMIADYVKETNNHVLFRVTPVYDGDNLVAKGVQMEAYSVEDDGEGVMFNVFVYNVQPGIEIDYATGESWLSGEERPAQTTNNKNNSNSNKSNNVDNKQSTNSSQNNSVNNSNNSTSNNKNTNTSTNSNANASTSNKNNNISNNSNSNQQVSGVIRGNSKSKIYHCPGQANYDDMKDSANLVVFNSEQDAINAGYRKAKR